MSARRTFADYKKQVLHALGNPAEAGLDISPATVVNDALEHIAALHHWRWLQTGHVKLSITANQDYVELPADFGSLSAIKHSSGFTRVMIPTSWDHILELRQSDVRDWDRSYWYVINLGNVELGQEDAGLTLPTLNLYPTPSTNEPDAIAMVYRRYLRRLVADTDRPQWPAYVDRLLSLLARSFATTDYDDNPESAYTAEVRTLLPDLIAHDGLAAGSFGLARGGLYPRTTPISPFYPSAGVPGPVLHRSS